MSSKLRVDITSDATVCGKITNAIGTETPVYTFLGIPYAAPPVGERRFQPPADLEYWTGTRDATKHGPICPQDIELSRLAHSPHPVPEDISEDCLYLNIYTPDPDPKKKYPVMLWIHGGAFIVGFSDLFNGTALAAYHDVVFVSINYRIGLFGFLCTGEDGVVNGNAGLLDQIAALQWVQQHIAKFGGDPNNVTIFGQSAGATCVSVLVASDLSRGLFHRAISESGVCTLPGDCIKQKQAGQVIRSQLRKRGFTSTDSHEILAHLKTLSSDELVKLQGDSYASLVVDHHLLKDTPENIYNSKQFQTIDYMIGFNSDEGAMFAILLNDNPISTKEEARMFVNNTIKNDAYRGIPNASNITDAAFDRYVSSKHEDKLLESLVDFSSDIIFVSRSIDVANKHSEAARTYVYMFDYRTSMSRNPDWVRADHDEELWMVLGFPFLRFPEHKWTKEEKEISMNMMKYWTNFAKTGNPNSSDLPKWPAYTNTKKEYIILKKEPEVDSNHKPDMVEFWIRSVPNIDNIYLIVLCQTFNRAVHIKQLKWGTPQYGNFKETLTLLLEILSKFYRSKQGVKK